MSAEPSTRNSILDAAEELFARQGYVATTIKQIGAQAGVNTALLYYYFGDKQSLYREMLERVFSGFATAGGAIDAAPTPEAAIRGFVMLQVELLAARPHLPRLIARELADHEAEHAEEQIAQIAAGVFERLCALIRDGQRAGAFRAEMDPRFAAISTIAQVIYLHIARPAVGILLGYGQQGAPAETVRDFGRHAADFALAALKAPPAPITPEV
jgi:TetR/AcrR family transcriptional regulator